MVSVSSIISVVHNIQLPMPGQRRPSHAASSLRVRRRNAKFEAQKLQLEIDAHAIADRNVESSSGVESWSDHQESVSLLLLLCSHTPPSPRSLPPRSGSHAKILGSENEDNMRMPRHMPKNISQEQRLFRPPCPESNSKTRHIQVITWMHELKDCRRHAVA